MSSERSPPEGGGADEATATGAKAKTRGDEELSDEEVTLQQATVKPAAQGGLTVSPTRRNAGPAFTPSNTPVTNLFAKSASGGEALLAGAKRTLETSVAEKASPLTPPALDARLQGLSLAVGGVGSLAAAAAAAAAEPRGGSPSAGATANPGVAPAGTSKRGVKRKEELQRRREEVEADDDAEDDDEEEGDDEEGDDDNEEDDAVSFVATEAQREAIVPLLEANAATLAQIEADYLRERRQLEAKYQGLRRPVYAARAGIVAGGANSGDAQQQQPLPGFWLNAMMHNSLLASYVEEHDRDALLFLQNVTCTELLSADDGPDAPSGFQLTFQFAESNPFFSNRELTKRLVVESLYGHGTPNLNESVGTDIQWKEGKKLTVMIEERQVPVGGGRGGRGRRGGGQGGGRTRTVRTEVPRESFFSFFGTRQDLGEEELATMTPEEQERDANGWSLDYAIANVFRTKLIPNALAWYLNEASDSDDEYYDDDDGEGEEDEDDEDDHEDDDEEEDDDDDAPPQKGSRRAPKPAKPSGGSGRVTKPSGDGAPRGAGSGGTPGDQGGSAQGDGEAKPECKPQ